MATAWKRSAKGWMNRAEDNLTASRDATVQQDVTRREPVLPPPGAISGGIWCGVNFANIANNLGYA